MQLMPSIKAKQKQSLIITPQLQQAIKLLQMTNLEIKQFLDDQALENPFLDVDYSDAEQPAAATSDHQNADHQMADAATDAPASLTELTPENNALSDDPTENSDMDNRYSSSEHDTVPTHPPNLPARTPAITPDRVTMLTGWDRLQILNRGYMPKSSARLNSPLRQNMQAWPIC
jgi:hypothetical protein